MLNDLANRALKAGISVMGEPITLARGGTSYEVRGLFQETYKSVDPETGAPVTTLQPVLSLSRLDLSIEPTRNDTVIARGVTYRVRDVQSDGHSGITVMLQRTSART